MVQLSVVVVVVVDNLSVYTFDKIVESAARFVAAAFFHGKTNKRKTHAFYYKAKKNKEEGKQATAVKNRANTYAFVVCKLLKLMQK